MKKLCLALILFLFCSLSANAQSGLFIGPNSSAITSPVTGESWLFNSANNTVSVWTGSSYLPVNTPFSNFNATVAPVAGNDNTQGYVVGSFWYNQTTNILYVAANVSTGAAVWTAVNAIVSTLPLNQLAQDGATAGQSIIWNGTSLAFVPGNPIINASTNLTGQVPAANGGTGVNNTSITANTVFAGPSSGSAAAAGFRLLAAADIPAITLSQLQQSGATTNQIPQWNGSQWVPATISGTGTVTNVTSGNLTGFFTTSISNSTTTPAISYAFANVGAHTLLANSTSGSGVPSMQAITLTAGTGLAISASGNIAANPTIAMTVPVASANGGTGVDNTSVAANKVFSGPVSGGSGASSFRSLVTADIPWATPGAIGASSISSGAFTTLSTSGASSVGGALTIGSNTGMNHNSSGIEVDTGTTGQLLTLQADSIQSISQSNLVSIGVNNIGTTGIVAWGYAVVAVTYNGTQFALAPNVIATISGNATLNSSHYNQLTFGVAPGIQTYKIYRTLCGSGAVSPLTTGLIASIAGSSTTYNDQGAAGDSTTPFTGDTTGSYIVGSNTVLIQNSTVSGTTGYFGSPIAVNGHALAINNSATGIANTYSPSPVSHGNIVINPLSNPGAPTVNPVGTTGSTTYNYVVTAVMADGTETAQSAAGTTTTGNATLSGSNYNSVSWTAVTGAQRYVVYRQSSGVYYVVSTPTMPINAATTTIHDTNNLLGTSFSPPTINNTGAIIWATDNIGNIGSSGANRPHNIYTGGKVFIGTHLGGTSAVPGIAAGAGAGGSPTVSLSATSNDVDGTITVLTGSSPTGSAATIVTITPAGVYSNANPAVVLTPINAAAAALSGTTQVFPSPGSATWTLVSGSSGLAATTTYKWCYHIAE